MKDHQTILLEIPAYCDPELEKTMQAALAKADQPENLHFAICYQSDDLETLERIKAFPHCRVMHVPVREAKGSCYARNLCQSLLEDETYVLHLDGHMRFARHWDTILIQQLSECPAEKPVITYYAMDYSNMMDLPPDDDAFDSMDAGSLIIAYEYEGSCRLRFRNSMRRLKDGAVRGAFISAHCFFGYAQVDRDVPLDPEMYFSGDECSISVRLFTHGYQVFHPQLQCVWHYFKPAATPLKKRFNTEVHDARVRQELHRMRVLYGFEEDSSISFGSYGVGSEHSVADFERFAGVDFRRGAASAGARHGYFETNHDCESWYLFQNKRWLRYLDYPDMLEAEQARIYVDLTALDENLQDRNRQLLLDTAEYPERLSFEDKRNAEYALVLAAPAIYMKGWDTRLIRQQKDCGIRSVLSMQTVGKMRSSEERHGEWPARTGILSGPAVFGKTEILSHIHAGLHSSPVLYGVQLWTRGYELYELGEQVLFNPADLADTVERLDGVELGTARTVQMYKTMWSDTQ